MKTINEVLNEAEEGHYRREAAKLLAKANLCRQKAAIAKRREKLLKARSAAAKPLVLFFIKPKPKQTIMNKALLNEIRGI
ncbi:MAG: hypothetical protein Q8N96_15035 [Methylovulum sp.]|nr:hypothetical protein [Methylovulum sp.]